jgi:hypothetical protein
MRVFCYDCGTSEETDWLVRCPKCQTKNIGLEPEEPWHWLNRLWASSRGWQGDGDELSLPWWFEKHPKLLPEWIDFKAQLNDVDAISPPTDHQLTSWSDFYDFWIRNSGILPLTQGTASDLVLSPKIGKLVHKLASNFSDHHYHQRERVEAEHRDQAERERPKLKAQEKKSSLIQRAKSPLKRR